MTSIYETELKEDKDGSWFRWLGEDEKGTKQKFRLGKDKQEAKRRLRLIVSLFDIQRGVAEFYGGSWVPEHLEAAKKIAKGKTAALPRLSLRVSDTDTVVESPETYAKTLALLGADFTPDPAAITQALGQIEKSQRKNRLLRSKLTGSDPNKDPTGQTIGMALDAFSKEVEKLNTLPEGLTPWGKTQLNQIKSWRKFAGSELLETDLADLTVEKAQKLVDTIRKRPLTFESKQTKRMTRKTAGSINKKIRHFFDWLDLSDEWEWEEPKRFRKLSYKIAPLTSEEKHELKLKKENWRLSDEEIKILYRYATPAERVLILLGLNCAFGAGEIGNLRVPYVKFDSQEIDGIRFKTGNDTKHHLWSETIEGLKWELTKREKLPKSEKMKDIFFLSDKGGPLWSVSAKGNYKNGIAKRWNDLMLRIKKDFPDFHSYSFGKLRKTAAIRVIEMANAEAASMILAHGIPTEDKLLSAYVNIPWKKLFKAQQEYGETIRPLLQIEANPFEQPPKDYIGKAKTERILEQYKEGIPVSQIANEAGVSIMTVYRHADRAGLRRI